VASSGAARIFFAAQAFAAQAGSLMGKLSFGTGSVRVEMDDALERLARRALEDVAPGLLPAVEETVARLESEATDKWPVRTGRSRDGLGHYVAITPSGDQVRGSLINTVDYARFVKSSKKGLGGRSAMVELMRKPVQAAAKVLAQELGAVAAKVVRGG
jgi:hypothetical protein